MKSISKHARLTPYLYFISVITYWFTDINQDNGSTSYFILLLCIPFIWQLVKPNKVLNISLGITFTCLSSYLILAYLSDVLNITSFSLARGFIIYGGIFVLANFIMSTWIIRNSLKPTL